MIGNMVVGIMSIVSIIVGILTTGILMIGVGIHIFGIVMASCVVCVVGFHRILANIKRIINLSIGLVLLAAEVGKGQED